MRDAAPIIVHVQAIRLMAPGGLTLTPLQAATVLGELSKIMTHFKFGSLSNARGSEDIEVAAAAG